jgi:hypothetical protein
MSAVVGSLIAVAGTLLGSFSTFWFQQKVAQRTETTARQERLRQDRLSACSEFAAAVLDWRRAMLAVWFRRDRERTDYHRAYADADRLGAVAESAKFRMLLLLDDPSLRELADSALRRAHSVYSARDKAEVEEQDAAFEAHMSLFVTTAAQLLR